MAKIRYFSDEYKRIFKKDTGVNHKIWAFFYAGIGLVLQAPILLYLAVVHVLTAFAVSLVNRASKAYELFLNRFKLPKAMVVMVATLAGLIIGGFLAPWLLASVPLIAKLFAFITPSVGGYACSILGLLVGTVAASYVGVSREYGGVVGLMLGLLSPIVMPLPLQAVFVGSLATGFAFSMLAKQGMRAYYYLRYGHTNADHYRLNDDLESKNSLLSRLYKVPVEVIQNFREWCIQAKEMIKKKAPSAGQKAAIDNLYFAFDSAKTNEEAEAVIDLMKHCGKFTSTGAQRWWLGIASAPALASPSLRATHQYSFFGEAIKNSKLEQPYHEIVQKLPGARYYS